MAREGRCRATEPQQVVVTSEAKVTLAVGGIRAGKTHVGALATILRAIHIPTDYDSCHAVTSPTFPMSKIGPEPKIHKLLSDRRLFPVSPLVHYAKSERTWYIANEAGGISKVRLFTAEHPDRWRGDAWLSWWGDEAAMYSEYAYTVGLGRVAETDGPILFTTTPNGHNFLYRIAKRASVDSPAASGYVHRVAPDGRVALVSWSSLQNVFLARTASWDELVEQYDPDTYAQEVLAHFVAKSGRVYKAFDPDVHVTEAAELNRRFPVLVGQDFNVDRMCSAFVQDGKDEAQHVVDEMEIPDADTYQLVTRLDRWCLARGVPKRNVTVVPDASSRKRQTAGSDTARSDLEILINAGYQVRGPRKNPLVKDRVNCVNGRFHRRKLLLHPRCKLTIQALESQAWADDGSPEKDGRYDNRTDALGYAVWYRYPLKGPRSLLDRRSAA